MGSSPEIIQSLSTLRQRIASWRDQRATVGLVPTMGALHEGHLSLVRKAAAECDRVVTTIFINPKQFAAHEDLNTYPRDESGDTEKLAALNVDLVYMPDQSQMYGDGFATDVAVTGLTDPLCGRSRPGFFGGVATVVTKLLIQVMADRAYFGEKDYQQLLVIRRLAMDLDIPVDIVGCPIVREPDGLALSSRNAYLSKDERAIAPALFETLSKITKGVANGEPCGPLEEQAKSMLLQKGFTKIDYIEIRDGETLRPVEKVELGAPPVRLFAAAYLGDTRLIDNIALSARP